MGKESWNCWCRSGAEDDYKKATTAILAKYPKTENIVVFSMSDDASSAINAAAEMTGDGILMLVTLFSGSYWEMLILWLEEI